jgi:HNH endonuclease
VVKRRTLRERLLSRLVITEAPDRLDPLGRPLVGPCLIWTGAIGLDGYGRIGLGARVEGIGYTHRVAYMELTGEPPGENLDHLCRVRACASPAHLERVTNQENIRRGNAGLHMRIKTHCPHGHPYDDANTLTTVNKRGTKVRNCRACQSDYRRRKKATT